MKNREWLRLRSLIKKDFLMAKNRITTLLFLYGFYFVIVYFSFQKVTPLLSSLGGNFTTLFVSVFLFQGAYIIAFMLFPQFIYSESIKDKHEIYFAYQYSILEIVIGKAVVLCFLSFIPALTLTLVLFFPLLEFSALLVINLFFIIPLSVFGFLAVNALFSWFTRAGRFLSAAFLLLIIFFISQMQKIFHAGLELSNGIIFLTFLAITVVLSAIVLIASRFIKKERCIIRD
jgi:hypothetical protein